MSLVGELFSVIFRAPSSVLFTDHGTVRAACVDDGRCEISLHLQVQVKEQIIVGWGMQKNNQYSAIL